jgi:hypothetical protein
VVRIFVGSLVAHVVSNNAYLFHLFTFEGYGFVQFDSEKVGIIASFLGGLSGIKYRQSGCCGCPRHISSSTFFGER